MSRRMGAALASGLRASLSAAQISRFRQARTPCYYRREYADITAVSSRKQVSCRWGRVTRRWRSGAPFFRAPSKHRWAPSPSGGVVSIPECAVSIEFVNFQGARR
jgi:hypothetical protein